MITEPYYFADKTDEINSLIYDNVAKIVTIKKMVFNDFHKNEISKHYNNFLSFPYVIENASEEIGISIFATELLELSCYIEGDSTRDCKEKFNEVKSKRTNFLPENNLDLITDYLDDFIHTMVYSYSVILKNTKEHHFFSNIDDEKIILLNLLQRYKDVRSDESKQIDIFWFIKLTKKISNLILDIFIDFIEQRLKILSITNESIGRENKTTYVENKISQIKWLGSQQEFCELVIQLENLNWIEKINEGERKKIAQSITKVFNLENTKKNLNSDEVNSFYQLLKGDFEKNVRTFPFLENVKYKKKFELIEKNNG